MTEPEIGDIILPTSVEHYRDSMKEAFELGVSSVEAENKRLKEWKIVEVDGPPVDGQWCVCKYDIGGQWDYQIACHINGSWIGQEAQDFKKPNYYKYLN